MSTYYYLESNEKTKSSENIILADLRALKKGKDPIWINKEEAENGIIHLTLETYDEIDKRPHYVHSYHYLNSPNCEFSMYFIRYGDNDQNPFLYYLSNKYDAKCIDEYDDGMVMKNDYRSNMEELTNAVVDGDELHSHLTYEEIGKAIDYDIELSYKWFNKHPSEVTINDYFKYAKKHTLVRRVQKYDAYTLEQCNENNYPTEANWDDTVRCQTQPKL